MQRGNVYRVRIPSTTFAGALAAAGAAVAADVAPPQALGAGKHCRSRLLEIRIWSDQQIKWGVQLWGKSTPIGGSTIDLESYLGEWSFGNTGQPGDGSKPTGYSFFYYYINGLDIAYQDLDNTGLIHVVLVNWDAATAKNAGATGEIVIELAFELLQGI